MAGPGAAVKTGYRHAFTFRGRATRSEFWWFVLFLVLTGLVLSVVLSLGVPLALAAVVHLVAVSIPFAACLTRRVRDAGRHPLWTLPAVLFIVAGPVIPLVVGAEALVAHGQASVDAEITPLDIFFMVYGLVVLMAA